MALHKNNPRISDAMMAYVMTELHGEQYEVALSIDPSTNKKCLSIITKKKISQMALGIDVSISAYSAFECFNNYHGFLTYFSSLKYEVSEVENGLCFTFPDVEWSEEFDENFHPTT